MAAGQPDQGEKDVAWTREAAAAWSRAAEARSQYLGQATEAMLDLAGIDVGSRVLDVAAGTGDQTFLAARRVGPTGSFLAFDIASDMLDIAADTERDRAWDEIEVALRPFDGPAGFEVPGELLFGVGRKGKGDRHARVE
jgi:predicted methyltransferase